MKTAKNFKRIVACILTFALVFTCIASALATVSAAEARIVTNGNGNATDVGIWYCTYNCDEYWEYRFHDPEALPVGYDSLLPDGTFGVPFSGNTDIIDFHIEKIAEAGIDFLMFDITNGGLSDKVPYGYDGTNAYSGNAWISEYAKLTVERINEWNASHEWQLRYAIAIGTYDEMIDSTSATSDALLAEYQAEAILADYVNSDVYGDAYYTFDGKPLLVLFDWREMDSEKTSIKEYINDDYSSLGQFTVRSASRGQSGSYGWLNGEEYGGITQHHDEVEMVAPGHYNAGLAVSRYQGDGSLTYDAGWNVILGGDNTPRIVMISSFNDYMENTAVFVTDASGANTAAGEETWSDPDLFWDKTIQHITELREKNAALGYDVVVPNTDFVDRSWNVTATVSAQLGNFVPSNACDGVYNINGADTANSAIASYDGNNLAYFTFSIAQPQTINTVAVKFASAEANSRPRDLAVDVLVDGVWKRVAEKHAAADEDIWQVKSNGHGDVNTMYFTFEAVECSAYRVTANRAGTRAYYGTTYGYNFRVNEVEGYFNPTVEPSDYTGIDAATVAGTAIPGYTSANYALGATVTTNLYGTVDLTKITDGTRTNRGYGFVSNGATGFTDTAIGYLQVNFAAAKEVNQVDFYLDGVQELYCYDYAVDVLSTSGAWVRAAQIHNNINVAHTKSEKISVKFAAVEGTAVRVSMNSYSHCQVVNGSSTPYRRVMSLAEIEVYYDSTITAADYTGIYAGGTVTENNIAGESKTYDTTIAGNVSENFALASNGATATTTAPLRTLSAASYGVANVIDGNHNTGMYGYFSAAGNANYSPVQSITVNFNGTKYLNKVNFVTCHTAEKKNVNDFAVDVLLPNGNWQRVAARHFSVEGLIATGQKQVVNFTFEAVSATAIRISGNVYTHSDVVGENYNYDAWTSYYPSRIFACAEIEAYYDSNVTTYTGIAVATDNGAIAPYTTSLNYALDATVSTNSSNLDAAGPLTVINDGAVSGRSLTYADRGGDVANDNVVRIDFMFDSEKVVNNVNLYADGTEAKYCFKDVAVEVLVDGKYWERVAELHDLSLTTSQKVPVYFAPVTTKGIRVVCDTSNQTNITYASFAEVEIYNDSAITAEQYTGINAFTLANTEMAGSDSTNFALGKKVTSSNTNWSLFAGTYPASFLTDGNTHAGTANICAISNYVDGVASFTVDFEEAYVLSKVTLRLSQHENTLRPDEYAIEVYTENGWVRVASAPSNTNSTQSFYFAPVECTKVRVVANNKLDAHSSTNFRIVELEAFYAELDESQYTGISTALGTANLSNKKGDVNGDSWFTAEDLSYAANWYIQARERIASNEAILDANRDGTYDIRDYLYVKELLATLAGASSYI